LAFNDPAVADFHDPVAVKIVELDEVCRMQQVNDGCFADLKDVPRQAITLTLSLILQTPQAVACVPGSRKAEAVREALLGPISETCPASALRLHPDAALYLDRDSASLL
jgi:glucosamine-6-phosphate deaminase